MRARIVQSTVVQRPNSLAVGIAVAAKVQQVRGSRLPGHEPECSIRVNSPLGRLSQLGLSISGFLSYGAWVFGLDRETRRRARRNLFAIVSTAGGPLVVLGLTIPDRTTAIIGFVIVGLLLVNGSIVLPIRSARAARRRRDDSHY
jgi:hypothetical protein